MLFLYITVTIVLNTWLVYDYLVIAQSLSPINTDKVDQGSEEPYQEHAHRVSLSFPVYSESKNECGVRYELCKNYSGYTMV